MKIRTLFTNAASVGALCALLSLGAGCPDDETEAGQDAGQSADLGDTSSAADGATDDIAADDAVADDTSGGAVDTTVSTNDTAISDDTSVAVDTAVAVDLQVDAPNAVDNCDEVSLTACFSNYDCEPSERCQDIGSTEVEVACCVTGPRGVSLPGAPCEESFECSTGVCLSSSESALLCSDQCETLEQCPDNMTQCDTLYFVEGLWCLP